MTLATLTRPSGATGARAGVQAVRAGTGPLFQLVRFGLVGGAASVVQLALYAFLADCVGAQPATIASWLVSTLVATEAHRRYSFPAAGATAAPAGRAEGDHLVGILTSLATLALSMIAVAALDDPAGAAGVLALIAVNAGVGGLRFLSLRWWLVGRRRRAGYRPVAAAAPVTAPLVRGPIVGEPIVREPSHLNS